MSQYWRRWYAYRTRGTCDSVQRLRRRPSAPTAHSSSSLAHGPATASCTVMRGLVRVDLGAACRGGRSFKLATGILRPRMCDNELGGAHALLIAARSTGAGRGQTTTSVRRHVPAHTPVCFRARACTPSQRAVCSSCLVFGHARLRRRPSHAAFHTHASRSDAPSLHGGWSREVFRLSLRTGASRPPHGEAAVAAG